jgi:drug/metabolite transporter (DMT)-like permease
VFFALTTLMTKALTRGEALITILFWLTLMQLLFGLATALWDGEMHLIDAATLPWLVLIGVAGLVAHLSLTMALSMAPASFVVPVDFIRLPLIAVVGAVFYAEPLEWPVLLGGAVILAAIWLNLRAGSPARPVG